MVVVFLLCGIGAYVVYASTIITIDEEEVYPVTSVMDGDTFKAKIGRHIITVRMLGTTSLWSHVALCRKSPVEVGRRAASPG